MIVEELTNKLISGHAVLWPSIAIVVIGIIVVIATFKSIWKVVGGVIISIGAIGVIECVISGTKLPDVELNPITRVDAYPVELRSENNTLYVFKEGIYKKVSAFTSTYVTKHDTMFVYHYESVGGAFLLGRG